jgi:hypothetical protein
MRVVTGIASLAAEPQHAAAAECAASLDCRAKEGRTGHWNV